jgi:uncharacterized protein YprB with RNaseH-like and TPR domain
VGSEQPAPRRTSIQRLFFDIETSPNVGLFWQPGYKLTLSYENIIKERAVICVAWKWVGKRNVQCLTWDRSQNDKAMLEQFVKVMHQADEIVTHNGDRFDTPWLRTRCLKHGISMSPNFTSIDTLKAARGKFNFNSNRLDYIAQFLDLGKKRPTGGFDLWKAVVLERDPGALKKMVAYCKHDVVLLEKVWDKMGPYLPAKTHGGNYLDECPECGSPNTVIHQHKTTAAGYRKVQFQCGDCHKYHTIAASRFESAKEV